MSYTGKGTLGTRQIGLTWGIHSFKLDIPINHQTIKTMALVSMATDICPC